MELKGIITIIIAAVGLLIAAGSLIVAILTYRSKKKLQKENLELQRKMLEYHKEKDAGEELAEKIDVYKGKLKKGSDRDIYCNHIIQKFKYLDFTGLNAILQKPLLLEKIYVKLKAKPSYRSADYHTIDDFKALEREKAEVTDKDFVTVFENLSHEYIRKQESLKLVILGLPGSGKTTLMKWIALQCVCEKKNIFSNFIPMFIPLKDLGRDPDKTYKSKNIRELTDDLLKSEALSASFIKDSFEDNQLLFLLDGLDEVADEDLRREVIDWIQKQNIRKNTLLVTSRSSGWQEAKGLRFPDSVPVYAVQDFDIADIERFLENWYQNIEVAVAGDVDKNGVVQKGKKQYEDLVAIIKSGSYENLRRLAVNPLLLTIIAIVHRTRAVLPKERHLLYEECLKVMIELWNVANKRLKVSFSVDNSMDNLSRLAVFLMKENRREMELREIKRLLPGDVEGKPLDFFLKEMVLKAGLLYESEGKYGFLHLTFQEYLAAWHFARGKDQNEILAYRDKDYWTETFKLFVNIANAHPFFNEIIDYLVEKEYWRQMDLWDECLRNIVIENIRKEIKLKFAEKILDILPTIENNEENELLIIQLFEHYPLYKYAEQFINKGWNLYNNALHPFVRSMGSPILNLAGELVQAKLIEDLKARINDSESREEKNPAQLLDFLYRDNNSFVMLIAGRRNVREFNFALAKIKSHNFFLVYLTFVSLLELRSLLYILELVDLQYLLKLLELLDLRYSLYLRNNRYHRYLRYLRNLRDFRDLQDLRDPRYLRYLRDQYLEKYQVIIEKHKQDIDAWADKAMAKLHALSDGELLKYFPGTTEEDLRILRTQSAC